MRGAIALLALLAALAGAAPAAAAPPRPYDLVVLEGEEAWHTVPSFGLEWSIPASARSSLASVHYRIRDPSGATVESEELNWAAERYTVGVPSAPGIYSVAVWLEDRDGRQGSAATASLRFDDSRPAPVVPLTPTRWVGRTDFPLTVPVDSRGAPPPPSGIGGYAYSTAAEGAPCARPDRCSEDETVANEGGAFTMPSAPEGVLPLQLVAVSGAGLSSSAAGEATLRVDLTDPVTRLDGRPQGWTRGPVRLVAGAEDARSGVNGERAFTAIRVDGAAPRIAPGPSVETTLIEEGAHRVAHYAGDAAGNANDGARANGHLNAPPRTAIVRIDRTRPTAGFLPQDPSDPELLRVRIRDSLSGADPGRGWIGVRPAGSSGRFQPLPAAAPAGDRLRARWDSASSPLGFYEFKAIAYDAAGNRTAVDRREGGAPMLLANPLKTTTSLRAGFGGQVLRWHRCRRRGERRRCRRQTIADFTRRPARRTVPYGRGLPLSGRLRTGPGAAPGSRPVRIVERFALGARWKTRATTTWTAPDGRFSTRLAPGPTREIVATYGGSRTQGRSAGPELWLGVRSGVRLRASSGVARVGGAPLVLRGKVAAQRGEIPLGGVSVQLQFRVPGVPWEEFRTVQSDSRGRFRLAYRFSDDDSRGARFRFRAHVPAQSEWPYEPGSSRPLAVRGR